MPEYIDIEVALKTAIKERKFVISEQDMLNTQRVFKTIYSDLAEFLYSLPRADVVEVVRCSECMYYTPDYKRFPDDIPYNRCDHPKLCWDVECYDLWLETSPDDFCKYGERRGTTSDE